MARLAALTAARAGGVLATGILAALASGAAAQAYPQLHVIALSQQVDRTSVAPSDVFHVTIHAKIAQTRDRLDELILGSFENCEIISNETVRTSGPGGTDFVERLTVQALAPGEATISPAYIDAVDPAIGKAMRFSSNAVRVHVTGAAPVPRALRGLSEVLGRVLLAAMIVAGFAAAVFVLVVIFVRRRRRTVRPDPAPIVSPAVVAVAGAPSARLRAAADTLARTRSDAALADVRGVLFELAGVTRGATLVDALRTLGEQDPALRGALLAAERAMFGPAAEREAAVAGLLAAVDAYAGPAAGRGAWTG